MAIWGNLNPCANMVGYRYNNFGFTLGADYWVMDNLLVGVNTGYSKTLTGVGEPEATSTPTSFPSTPTPPFSEGLLC